MTNPTCPHCGVGIGEHEATRCLDAWVATRVFGWTEPLVGTLCYSSDISAAWEVVEKHPVGKWTWSIRQNDDGKWWAEVRLGFCTSFLESHIGVSKSAPLAICRAAVLAAGEKP